MAHSSWLIVVVVAAGCSHHDERVAPKAESTFKPVALAPDVLPGWTFRSAAQGWWSAGGDEQLYVSDVDLGHLCDGKSSRERAELVAGVFREASRRVGAATLAVNADALSARVGSPIACITGVNADAHAHVFSCGVARDGGPVFGIEYTSYRNDSLDVLDARARSLIGSVAERLR